MSALAKKSAEIINDLTSKQDEAGSTLNAQDMMSIMKASSQCLSIIDSHLGDNIKGISSALNNTQALKCATQAHRKSSGSTREKIRARTSSLRATFQSSTVDSDIQCAILSCTTAISVLLPAAKSDSRPRRANDQPSTAIASSSLESSEETSSAAAAGGLVVNNKVIASPPEGEAQYSPLMFVNIINAEADAFSGQKGISHVKAVKDAIVARGWVPVKKTQLDRIIRTHNDSTKLATLLSYT